MPTIQVLVRHRVAVLDVNGDLPTGNLVLRRELEKLLDKGATRFVLDLADVHFLGSSVIGDLITMLHRARRKDGELLLASLSSPVRKVLAMSKLITVFSIFDTVEQALEHLGEAGRGAAM